MSTSAAPALPASYNIPKEQPQPTDNATDTATVHRNGL